MTQMASKTSEADAREAVEDAGGSVGQTYKPRNEGGSHLFAYLFVNCGGRSATVYRRKVDGAGCWRVEGALDGWYGYKGDAIMRALGIVASVNAGAA